MPKQQDNKHSIVMCFSGHDPSGGAGLQADIEAITANHAHACTIVTALTVQDSVNVQQVAPVELSLFQASTDAILNDVSVNVFKTGLLADAQIAQAVANIATQHADIPLVIDPVLASGAGTELANAELVKVIQKQLLPLATIATPNLPEAQRLSGEQDADACAEKILAMGCQYVLLTGTHATTDNVINSLYHGDSKIEFEVERLNGDYHGSGCTLASSLAANLANGHDINTSVSMALDYTWQSLKHAQAIGKGQLLPNHHFAHD